MNATIWLGGRKLDIKTIRPRVLPISSNYVYVIWFLKYLNTSNKLDNLSTQFASC